MNDAIDRENAEAAALLVRRIADDANLGQRDIAIDVENLETAVATSVFRNHRIGRLEYPGRRIRDEIRIGDRDRIARYHTRVADVHGADGLGGIAEKLGIGNR